MRRISLKLAYFFFFSILGFCLSTPNRLWAAGEISITGIQAEKLAPDQYSLNAVVSNHTQTAQEIILRAQISFYDRSSPDGDRPVAVIRKDFIEILKPLETKPLTISMINEGSPVAGAVREEPTLRIRRLREWNY